MSTKLDQKNIADMKAAVETYRSNCDDLFAKVQTSVTTLIGSGFVGDAATEYNNFFTAISPRISTQLTGTEESVCAMLIKIIDNVAQMIDVVDPSIAENNKQAGSGN